MPVVNVYGTDKSETLTGTDDTNNIYGYGGDDILYGLGGSDALIGGTGADTMYGGKGLDTYFVEDTGDQVKENAGEGYDSVQTSVNWIATAGSEIEEIFSGGDGTKALQITGNTHSDSYALRIFGNGLTNKLDDGGGRADLFGGYGDDVYVVTNALTEVIEFNGFDDYNPGHGPDVPPPPPPNPLLEGYDTVRTNLATYTLPDNVEQLVFFGAGDFKGTGDAGNNAIIGGAGNDTLDGGAGVDRLTGGAGNDVYVFDDARDFAVEAAGGGTDEIRTTVSAVASANVEKLTFIGTGAFSGYANATGTAITGGSGNDSLFGGAAADTLDGGGGNNLLIGKGGADVFVAHPEFSGVARIVDFLSKTDKVGIVAQDDTTYYFVTNKENFDPGLEGHPMTANKDHLYYDQPTGKLYDEGEFFVVSNGQVLVGDHRLIATFDNHPELLQSDLIFV